MFVCHQRILIIHMEINWNISLEVPDFTSLILVFQYKKEYKYFLLKLVGLLRSCLELKNYLNVFSEKLDLKS